MRKVGILCSGGDSQGMNACVKTIVNCCQHAGIVPVGIFKGYEGLLTKQFRTLTNDEVASIALLGGTYLKTSRCPEFMDMKNVQKGAHHLKSAGIEALIVIGGNGSYRGALDLQRCGTNIICIPGTIDNDLFYTDMTLGFDTAVSNAVWAVENIKQTMFSNNRVFVAKVMGRKCGHIALHVATVCNASSLSVLEHPKTLDEIVIDVKNALELGVSSPLVVVNEHVPYSLDDVRNAIEHKLDVEVRTGELGYIQRGGTPSVKDRELAMIWGVSAVECFKKKEYGIALGYTDHHVSKVTIEQAINSEDVFDDELYSHFLALHQR